MIIVSNRHDQSLTPGPDFGDHLTPGRTMSRFSGVVAAIRIGRRARAAGHDAIADPLGWCNCRCSGGIPNLDSQGSGR